MKCVCFELLGFYGERLSTEVCTPYITPTLTHPVVKATEHRKTSQFHAFALKVSGAI